MQSKSDLSDDVDDHSIRTLRYRWGQEEKVSSSLDYSLVRDKCVLCSHDSILQVTFYLRKKMVKNLIFKNKSEGDTFVRSLKQLQSSEIDN